jgi:hypothetical protein
MKSLKFIWFTMHQEAGTKEKVKVAGILKLT